MQKSILIFLILSLVTFASCENRQNAFDSNDIAIAQNNKVSNTQPGKTTITIEGERITITTLSEWSRFNSDGNFSDNCKNFLRMFIENCSDFKEFNTVKISDWEVIRDPDVYGYDLAFNFKVTESELETLPIGEYKTTVRDAVDCYMRFDGNAPNAFVTDKMFTSDSAHSVAEYLTSYYSWYLPDYGAATKTLPLVNYMVVTYGENGKMPIEFFKEKTYEIFGISPDMDEIGNLVSNGYISAFPLGGNTSYAIIDEKVEDDKTVITVQFFADCNKFIKSDVIEYYVGKDFKLLGCNVISMSDYAPYGLTNKFYTLMS